MEENNGYNITEKFSSIGNLVALAKGSGKNTKFKADDIENYLSDSSKYHQELRSVSDYFYIQNGIYKNIINAFSNLPTLDNMILPTAKTLKKSQDKSYDTYFDKINNYTDSINMKLTVRTILKSVAKYGGYVGYERTNGKDVYIQTLPLDYCRIKYKIGHEYQIEFNFKYFDKFWNKEDLDLAWQIYPNEFKRLYNKFKKDSKSREPEWQMIDINNTYCCLADEDDVNFIPMFTGMFEALINNEEYKDMNKAGKELDAQKIVVQKVPMTNEGVITMPLEQVRFFHSQLKKVLPKNANGLTTPLAVEEVSFVNQNKQKDDMLISAERGVFVNSGMSSSLFADNRGSMGLNMNIELISSNIFSVLEKIEEMFNGKFNRIVKSKNYNFKLKIFRTTNVNVGENFERQLKLLNIGGSLTTLLALSGFDSETYCTLLQVEDSLGLKELLKIPESIHTQSGKDKTDNETNGRPKKDDKELSDEGEKTREIDANNPKNRV